jgi:hypothetical protein
MDSVEMTIREVVQLRDGRKWLGILAVAQLCAELSGPIIAVFFYTRVLSDWEFCLCTDGITMEGLLSHKDL